MIGVDVAYRISPGDIRRDGRKPCAWRDCTDYATVDDEIHLCVTHYSRVVDDWMAAQRRRAERAKAVEAKVERGEALDSDEKPPGWVYYIRVGALVKVGFSKNLHSRLPAYPPDSELLAVEPGTRKVERMRHSQFDAFRAEAREWYRPNDELDAWVEKVRAQHGDPKGYAYKPRKLGDRRPAGKSSSRARIV